ncbi:MAG: MerR family transcriptional regulator [Oscillospiraceae bacterium]|nr:MerR family transcriptional regulator [Oscillospiraceae bacterium]
MENKNIESKSTEGIKKTDKLLSIKEFSEMIDLEQSVLRYWDEIGIFPPALRNTDNGYRFYSPDQIIFVNFIKVLSSLKISLKVIGSIRRERTPETILRLMEKQENVLDQELKRLQEAYSTIHVLRGTIQQGMNVQDADQISVQPLGSMQITLGPRNKSGEQFDFYREFTRYCKYAKKNRINLNTPIGGYFESMEAFCKKPWAPTHFFSVDPQGKDNRPAGRYLVGYRRGLYGRMEDTAQRLKEHAAQHGLSFSGPVYVVYLLDEISMNDPSQYLSQICVACQPE